MANRRSRLDSISGMRFDVHACNMDIVSTFCQALGRKFHLVHYDNGFATFEFQNR